jgi:peptide/nickel transport system ATP-binding protein
LQESEPKNDEEEKGSQIVEQSNILLKVENVTRYFPIKGSFLSNLISGSGVKQEVHAVDNVSFTLKRTEILGLVGESGCGKTTTGKMICALETPTSGKIFFQGKLVSDIAALDAKNLRRSIQIIFQNPYESLDPKFTIFESLEEPLRTYGIGASKGERTAIIEKMMTRVGISPGLKDYYPNKLSGGQRQRVALARSFLLDPVLLIADEPVSMLDASVRASILNILLDMRNSIGTSVILITHDLATARHICDTICVMYLG